ncbi:MAG TPA: hypothetical protein VN667_10905 [Burkholderiales bacterium]|nr:hypothetical protein [Burkholderiales bacterium]
MDASFKPSTSCMQRADLLTIFAAIRARPMARCNSAGTVYKKYRQTAAQGSGCAPHVSQGRHPCARETPEKFFPGDRILLRPPFVYAA